MNKPARGRAETTGAAEVYRALHAVGAPILVLPNAWDPFSAALFASVGAHAIATTSGAVAWANGVPDGGALGATAAVLAASRIVAAVAVPVSVDFEGGYGDEPEQVAAAVSELARTGAAGLNLEDSALGRGQRLSPDDAAVRIAAARTAANGGAAGRMFLNARVDTFLLEKGSRTELVSDAVARGLLYAEAGADGVFVPGVLDQRSIREICERIPLPVNVMAAPGGASVCELAGWGVRRVSVGTALAQAAYGSASRAARELLTDGTYRGLDGGIEYLQANALMTAPPR